MQTLVFDVNETLSDQSIFTERFADVGAPPALAQAWYAGTLRDGISLAVAAATAPYAEVAATGLRGLLSGVDGLDRPLPDAVDYVMAGFGELSVHPDVADGLRALRAAGHRLVTLSNGAPEVADGLLRRAGVRDQVDLLLSAHDAGAWKPHPSAYRYAAEQAATPITELVMVAVHPWDLDGAHRAGLMTAFVDRTGAPWPDVFAVPDHHVARLGELVDALTVGQAVGQEGDQRV